MQAYLTLVTFVSLVGFYAAAAILAGAIPSFVLGIEDTSALRGTIATTLGVIITTAPLWILHWRALRRLWNKYGASGRGYLFLVNSLGVFVTAVMAGQFVRHATALLLEASIVSGSDIASLWTIGGRFILAAILWNHHWRMLQNEIGDTSPRARMVTS